MIQFDVFLPLNYTDGSPIEPRKFLDLQQLFASQFGGLIFLPHTDERFSNRDDVIYPGDMVIYQSPTAKLQSKRRLMLLRRLMELIEMKWKNKLGQENVFIVERDIERTGPHSPQDCWRNRVRPGQRGRWRRAGHVDPGRQDRRSSGV